MDFICELIFEIILEGFFGLTIENPAVKTWTKTVIFLVFSELVASVGILAGVNAYRRGNVEGGIVCGVIGIVLAVGFAIGAVYGHKREWKQSDD